MSVTGSVDNWPVGRRDEDPLITGGLVSEAVPVLPYAGTSGHSGSETSEERARTEDADGTTSVRQRAALEWLTLRGERGGTVAEFRVVSGYHHGQASSVLSVLHLEGRINRLAERRNRCQVYVIPLYVNGRETVDHRSNRSKSEVDQETLARAWEQGYTAGYADEFGDQRNNPYREM